MTSEPTQTHVVLNVPDKPPTNKGELDALIDAFVVKYGMPVAEIHLSDDVAASLVAVGFSPDAVRYRGSNIVRNTLVFRMLGQVNLPAKVVDAGTKKVEVDSPFAWAVLGVVGILCIVILRYFGRGF